MSSKFPPLTRPALLLIDFQNDFCSPGGYADVHLSSGDASSDGDDGAGTNDTLKWVRDIIPNAQRLLESASAASRHIPIYHTREGYAPDLSDCFPLKRERSKRGGCEIGSPGPLGRLLIRGERGHAIIPELAPKSGEVVIDKAGYCAFRNTALHRMLQEQHVKEIVIAGVTADVCVHTTLRSAVELGYRCYYVKDAISTFDPDIRKACETMVTVEGGIWGELVTTEETVEMFEMFLENQETNPLQEDGKMPELMDNNTNENGDDKEVDAAPVAQAPPTTTGGVQAPITAKRQPKKGKRGRDKPGTVRPPKKCKGCGEIGRSLVEQLTCRGTGGPKWCWNKAEVEAFRARQGR